MPPSITFNAGDTSKTFRFTATQDQDNDDGESVKLTFGNTLPTGVSAGTTDEAVVSITDDDVPSVSVSFEQADYTVVEGSTETVTVTLNADPERTVIIPITNRPGRGVQRRLLRRAPQYHLQRRRHLENLPLHGHPGPGQRRRGEREAHLREHPADRGECRDTDEAVVTITDDDVPSVSVSFEQADYTVVEGSTETVTVTLNADPERTVIIPITTTDQDGASSADYSGVPASITFNAGDTSKTFRFTATQDQDNDDGESVKLTFGNTLPTGVSAGNTDEAVVSITDDDVPASECELRAG